MKKTVLLIFVFISSIGFSQAPIAKIQNHLESQKEINNLSSQDISEWTVISTGNSKATKIDNYYIQQK